MKKQRQRIAIAITGASGACYGLSLLASLLQAEHASNLEIHLTVSKSGQKVLAVEHGLRVDLENFNIADLGLEARDNLTYHHYENVASALASGSFKCSAMAIVPCSMGTLSRIAHGNSGNLIERAADVMIKERRPLILLPRETPYSTIHLENMLTLSRLGVTIMPASPGYYGNPKSIDDMIEFMVARVLDHLKIENQMGPRWGEKKA